MFAVEVQDHIMIAHSFPSEVFGPAQGLHGATFTVNLAFFASDIDKHGMVVDIGLATKVLSEVLEPLRYKNLDELEQFKGKFTTTEFLCRYIFDQVLIELKQGKLADDSRVEKLRVSLQESYMARAWFEGEV
jgi:6-pyruvoyl-tetrahydropterin synthase